MNKLLIIAHRGESYLAPENSLAAINLAWRSCADAIEVDIRLTKDNQVVVFHDANTKRISGKYKKIKNSDLEGLKKLDIGAFKSEKYIGERIPTLMEVLETVPSDKKILIEIKSSCKIIPYLKEVIQSSSLQANQIEIISFNLNTLIEVRKEIPQLSVFWILALDYYWIRKWFKPSVKKIIKKAIKYNIRGLDLWSGNMLDNDTIKKIRAAGLKIYTWTVNNPEKARNLVNMNVDGITTDRAKWMRDKLFD